MSPIARKALLTGGVASLGVILLGAVYLLLFGSTESSSGAAAALTTAAAAATRKALRDRVLTALTEWVADAKEEKGKVLLEEAKAQMGEVAAEIDKMTLAEKVELANRMEPPPLPSVRSDLDKGGS